MFGSVSECAFQWDCELVCLPVSLCVCLRGGISGPASVCDCASLCYLCMPPTVLECSSPPPPSAHTSWLQEPGRIWGHGFAWAWGWWAAVGEEGGLRGGPYISHSSQEKRGQGSPSSHPSDLCVRCLPAHPRGAAGDAASCLAGPKPGGPGTRGQSPAS